MVRKNNLTVLEFLAVSVFGLIWLLTVVKNGTLTDFGLSFWGPHGHDAIFHLALIQRFALEPFSLVNPLLFQTTLTNYHFLFDYLAGILVRLSGLSALDWYFRLLPTFVTVALGVLVLHLTKLWQYARSSRVMALFIVFLSGSFGHFINVIFGEGLYGGESRFWATQGISTLLNPPLALSFVWLMLWLLLLRSFRQKANWRTGILMLILTGVMFETKAYSAVLVSAGLFLTAVWEVWRTKDVLANKGLLTLSLATLAVVGGIATSLTKNSAGLFVFEPLFLVKTMLASPDRLNLGRWSEAWDNYLAAGSLIRLSLLQLLALVLFVVGNFGVRLTAFWRFDKLNFEQRLLVVITVLGVLAPILAIQKGTPWNTIQFMYYSLFAAGLLAAPVWAKWLRRANNLAVLGLRLGVLLLLTLPTTLGTLSDYLSPVPSSVVPYEELRALATVPDGVVLSPLFDKSVGRPLAEPKPLYGYDSTAYVSAMTGQISVLADEVNLQIMGYDFSKARKEHGRFVSTSDAEYLSEYLSRYEVKTIYNLKIRQLLSLSALGYEPIFDSGNFKVYTRRQ